MRSVRTIRPLGKYGAAKVSFGGHGHQVENSIVGQRDSERHVGGLRLGLAIGMQARLPDEAAQRLHAERMKCSMLSPAVTATNQPTRSIRHQLPAEGSRRPLFGLDAASAGGGDGGAGRAGMARTAVGRSLYRQRVAELDEITTLSKSLRQRLAAEGWEVGRPGIAQVFRVGGWDGALPGGGQWPDAETVETVWMPEGDGGEAGDGSEARGERGGRRRAGRGRRSAFRARWGAR